MRLVEVLNLRKADWKAKQNITFLLIIWRFRMERPTLFNRTRQKRHAISLQWARWFLHVPVQDLQYPLILIEIFLTFRIAMLVADFWVLFTISATSRIVVISQSVLTFLRLVPHHLEHFLIGLLNHFQRMGKVRKPAALVGLKWTVATRYYQRSLQVHYLLSFTRYFWGMFCFFYFVFSIIELIDCGCIDFFFLGGFK